MDEECRRVLAELEQYLDCECSAQLEQVIGEHLGICGPCLDRADFEAELRAIIARKCRDAAPSGLLDRVLAALRRT